MTSNPNHAAAGNDQSPEPGSAPGGAAPETDSSPAAPRGYPGAVVQGPWPGTEALHADSGATPERSGTDAPNGGETTPGVTSYGPLGAGSLPENDRRIWEPRPTRPAPAGPPAGPAQRSGPEVPGPRQPGPDDHTPSPSPGPGPASGPAPDGPAPAAGGRERVAHRLRLGDLAADSRMRIWKRRLLVAVVAGLIFTFIFTWRTGLTAAVLAAIADAIYRSRTTASIPPGIKLTGAQKRTQRQLARMERAGYRALHSRPIPGSREQIDHFVAGPTGVYAIDSEDWNKRLPVRTKNARQLWHGPFSKKDRLEHARWEAKQASEQLAAALGREIYVRPAMAVYGPQIPWTVATIRDVDVFSGNRLRKYLRRNAMMKDRPKLSAAEIEQIYVAAARVLPLHGASARTPVG